jgi:hypothetical protein
MKLGTWRATIGAASLAFAILTWAQSASAQVRIAPSLSWGEDAELAVGARLLMSMSRILSSEADRGLASKIDLVVPFDWFVDCSDCTYFEVTPGLIVPLTVKDVGPYLGVGVNIARLSVDSSGRDESDVSVGLGLSGGILFPVGDFVAFGEARTALGGREQIVISIGLQVGGTRN